jgi:glycosyltransferase involved in cell wall biosynthesis
VCREIWYHEMPLPVAVAGRYMLEPYWLRRYRDVPTLTVSASSRDSLADYGLRNLTVVPEGITRRPRPGVEREQHPTVVFVGRLAPNKGPLEALAAFELLRRRMPEAQLWIVGDGPQRSTIAARASAGVTVFGRVGQAERDELLARAHVLVVTSVREGWGLVVDEAAGMGTPAIGYDRPGLRDSVPAARGTLVAPTAAALADALERRLPELVSAPASEGWSGGAVDWDTVAQTVLEEAVNRSGLRHDKELRWKPAR